MKRTATFLVAAACATAAGVLFVSPVIGTDLMKQKTVDPQDVDKGTPMLPDGITAKNLDAAASIHRSLSEVTEDALTKDHFTSVVAWLASQDKDRITASEKISQDDLNAQIDKVNAAFKSKYGKDLAIDGKKSYQGYVLIVTGLVIDPDSLVDHWPVTAAVLPHAADSGGKASQADIDQAKNKLFGGRVKLEKNREVALVRLPARNGLPAITASMIHELPNSWRFDVPNNVSAQTLHDNLLKTLTALASQTTWPADIDEAGRLMTQQIIASLYSVDIPGNVPQSASEK